MNIVLILFAVLFVAAPVKGNKSIAPGTAKANISPITLPADSNKPGAAKEAPVLIDSRFPRKGAVAPWEKTNDVEPISTVQTC